jgi:hypothetical protein
LTTSTAPVGASGLSAISKTAPRTQFRIEFNGENDTDSTADHIGY